MVEDKEKISVIGVVVDSKDMNEVQMVKYLSQCLVMVKNKFGTEVELIVFVNKDLNKTFAITPLPSISFSRPAPGTSLLSSSIIKSRPLCQGGTLLSTLPTGCPICGVGAGEPAGHA